MNRIDYKQLIPYAVAIVVFIAIALIYFSPLLAGKQLYQSDIVNYRGSAQEIKDFRNATGEEALWTNSMFGGMPAYQIDVSFKTNIAKVLNNMFKLWLPHPASILFVLLLCFFILLIAMKADPWLAVVGAIAFAFSSYFFLTISVGHNAKTLAIAYMPAILAGIILAYRGRYLAGAALAALFMAVEISVNHVQMTYYFMMIAGFVVLFEFIYAIIKKNLANFLKASAFLVVAAGISIIPNISNLWTSSEYMEETIRGKPELTSNSEVRSSGLDKDYITQWSYGIGETFSFMIPNVKGGGDAAIGETKSALDKVDRNYRKEIAQMNHYWGNMPFTAGPVYAGAFVCFLFILGLFIVRGKLKWALFGVTVLAIMLSWGHNFMPLTDFFISNVPFYNKFRAVSSILIIVELTIPLLAMLALKEIADHPGLIKEKKSVFFTALGLTAGLTLIFVTMPATFFDFIKDTEKTQFDEYLKQGAAQSQIDDFMSNLEIARISIFRMSCLRTIAFIVLGAGLLWMYASVKKMSKYVLYAGVALLVLIDMVPVDKKYLNNEKFIEKNKNENPFTLSVADKAILEDTAASYRVLNLTAGNFTTDATTSFYHKSIGGYHAAKLRRYQDLIENRIIKEHDRLIKTLKANVPDSVLMATLYGLTSLNMLNTKYFIYNPDAGPLRNPAALGNAWFVEQVRMVENPDEEIKALDNFIPSNTAIVDKRFEKEAGAFSGGKQAGASILLTDYKPNHLTYEAKDLTNSQLAVFSEIYYDKGWKAYIDGTEAPYFRADYVLRAMVIPAGNHKIEFKFEPKSYVTGEKISLAGSVLLVLLVAGALFFEYRKKKKTPAEPLSQNVEKADASPANKRKQNIVPKPKRK
ncbi:MAG TPA: YfhO family protein [Bacteroidales bacterium]|nr:YfhO family protein [Bacteroidales bacterium]